MQHISWQFEFQACPVLGPAEAAAVEELDQNINVIKAVATIA
jgi:hypothetical protein